MPRNRPIIDEFTGLSIDQIVKQSMTVHPTWTARDHQDYLLSETSYYRADLKLDALGRPNEADVTSEQCQMRGGCTHERLDGLALCLEHYVAVAALMCPTGGW